MKLSLMPRGVEHAVGLKNNFEDQGVKLSPMPRGVEHHSFKQRSYNRSGEIISDAERR